MKSYSLLSLLLALSLAACICALFVSLQNFTRLEEALVRVYRRSDLIKIDEPTLAHVCFLQQPAPFVYQYQLALPRDTSVYLTLMAGQRDENGKFPVFQTVRIDGPSDHSELPEQFRLTLSINQDRGLYTPNVHGTGVVEVLEKREGRKLPGSKNIEMGYAALTKVGVRSHVVSFDPKSHQLLEKIRGQGPPPDPNAIPTELIAIIHPNRELPESAIESP